MKTTQSVESEQTVAVTTKPKPLRTVSGMDKPVVAAVEVVVAKPAAKKTVKVVAKIPVKVTAKTPAEVAVSVKPVVAKVEAPRIPMSIQIWNAIKDRELGLFGLSDQTVVKYCTPMDLDPSKCMLKYKVSSVIPALEEVVRRDFDFEVQGAHLVVSKKSKQ